MTRIKSTAAIVLALTLLLALNAQSATAAVAAKDKEAIEKAVAWLSTNVAASRASGGELTDLVVAFAAAKKAGIAIPLIEGQAATTFFADKLALKAPAYSVESAGSTAKLGLAAVAAGLNPCSFGGVNVVGKLDITYLGASGPGIYGVKTSFNQALSMLAIKAAGAKIPQSAARALIAGQAKFGWGYHLKPKLAADVESTSLAIEALMAERKTVGSAKNVRLKRAWRFIAYQRNRDGGFGPGGKGDKTQANTTAYALRAADALGKSALRAKAQLRSLQGGDGGFNSSEAEAGSRVMATIEAIPALAGLHHPVVGLHKPAC